MSNYSLPICILAVDLEHSMHIRFMISTGTIPVKSCWTVYFNSSLCKKKLIIISEHVNSNYLV
jgi:hypothetical protein